MAKQLVIGIVDIGARRWQRHCFLPMTFVVEAFFAKSLRSAAVSYVSVLYFGITSDHVHHAPCYNLSYRASAGGMPSAEQFQ